MENEKDIPRFPGTNCYGCREGLTWEEQEWYNENAQTCCDGRMCGCMGKPTEPPHCFKCMEIGAKLTEEKMKAEEKKND